MYPYPFRYFRAGSLPEALSLVGELGEEAKFIAGGQSLIPLMKLRLARPAALVDLNFVPGLAEVTLSGGVAKLGAMMRHAEIAKSQPAEMIPIVHDCAAGIADVQVRNRGTIGGSVAEADPSSDWIAVLLALGADIHVVGQKGERVIPIQNFVLDAYTADLQAQELVRQVSFKIPPKHSGGAYLAFKRAAPVYATSSIAVQLALGDHDACAAARLVAGCVGLTAQRLFEAEKVLGGQRVDEKAIEAAAEAAMAAVNPPADQRGSTEYKRTLLGALVRRALKAALRRARGEAVEVTHNYAAR